MVPRAGEVQWCSLYQSSPTIDCSTAHHNNTAKISYRGIYDNRPQTYPKGQYDPGGDIKLLRRSK